MSQGCGGADGGTEHIPLREGSKAGEKPSLHLLSSTEKKESLLVLVINFLLFSILPKIF